MAIAPDAAVVREDDFETVHYPADEIRLIEGEVEFYQNGNWTRGDPGMVQMLPAGVAHSVRIPTGTARLGLEG